MPHSPDFLTPPMKRTLAFLRRNFKGKEFSTLDIPMHILRGSQSVTFNALTVRGFLEKISDKFYKLKGK